MVNFVNNSYPVETRKEIKLNVYMRQNRHRSLYDIVM